MKKLIYSSIFLFVFFSCTSTKEKQSFSPGEIWPDDQGEHINAHGGGILYFSDKYYWFGEHKVAGALGNTAQVGVGCYSSLDLYNWKNEGIALKVVEDDSTSAITKGCIIERPKVVYNTKTQKFVMWFHLEIKGKAYDEARSGIAISDKVTGPYTFVKSFRPNAGFWPVNVQAFHHNGVSKNVKNSYCGGIGCLPAHPDSLNLLGRDFINGQMARDMNLFVDDDGTAYQIYTSEENSTIHISRLSDDYMSCSGQYIRIFPDRYMEAPAMFKYKDKYYLISSGCTGWDPNAARLAMADSVFGNWTELGNPCIGKDSAITFHSQATFVLPVAGKKDAFIFLADRWDPKNPIDGSYIWLPLFFKDGKPMLQWMDNWNLGVFAKNEYF